MLHRRAAPFGVLCLTLLFAGLFSTPAQADPIISDYDTFGAWQSALSGGHQNILFNNPGQYPSIASGPATTVTGGINQSKDIGTSPTNGLYVNFTAGENLTGTGGQAVIVPVDGSTGSISITPNPLNDLVGFSGIAFKTVFDKKPSSFEVEVFYSSNDGKTTSSETFNFNPKNANPFSGFIPDAGYYITQVDILNIGGTELTKLEQVRVQPLIGGDDGPVNPIDTPIPEPASMLVWGIGGLGLLGVRYYRRRSQTTVTA